ncbi:acyl-CoA dehydrogenase family protein [Streptomyces sp. PTD5-9]|uniref:acyl-CoA dehydrogenase family protein n=1 Tax=Streptomyces sp. PTD5-9 TaxID=3120150 RepID=UPI0030082D7C
MPGTVDGRVSTRVTPALRARLRESAERTDTTAAPDHEALAELRRSGLLATAVPRAYGGAGGTATDVNRVVARLAEVNPSLAIIAFQHFAVSARITEWGSPEQHARLLPALADGSCLAASSWSETGAGAAKQNLSSTAVRQTDGRWRIDAAKSFTTGAGIADLYLLLVRTGPARAVTHDGHHDDDADGRGLDSGHNSGHSSGQDSGRDADDGGGDGHHDRGLDGDDDGYGAPGQTFFLVPADLPGIVPDLGLDLVGMRGSATGLISFEGCVVDDDARLGPPGRAAAIISGVRSSGATLGAVSIGIAQAALNLALDHAQRRGLLALPAVRQRLAALATRLESARGLVELAGARITENPGLTTLHSKLHASETAEEICLQAARMLGSSGYLTGTPLNRLLADARGVSLMGPTNDLCRDILAASWPS